MARSIPLIHFTLNNSDISGNTITNSGSGGSTYNGTAVNPGAIVAGKSGEALTFDGTTYIRVLENTETIKQKVFSVSMFFKTSYSADTQTLWSTINQLSSTGYGMRIILETNGAITLSTRSTNSTYTKTTTLAGLNDDAWHNIVLVSLNGYSNNNFILLIDGVLSMYTDTSMNYSATTQTFVIGGYNNDTTKSNIVPNFTGLIDEFRYFNYDLYPHEIFEEYHVINGTTSPFTLTGIGKTVDPYIISSVSDFYQMKLAMFGEYKLSSNIEFNPNEWSGQIEHPLMSFCGSLDGNNKIISGFKTNSALYTYADHYYYGIFPKSTNLRLNGLVQYFNNIILDNCHIIPSSGKIYCAGLLVGFGDSKIHNVFVKNSSIQLTITESSYSPSIGIINGYSSVISFEGSNLHADNCTIVYNTTTTDVPYISGLIGRLNGYSSVFKLTDSSIKNSSISFRGGNGAYISGLIYGRKVENCYIENTILTDIDNSSTKVRGLSSADNNGCYSNATYVNISPSKIFPLSDAEQDVPINVELNYYVTDNLPAGFSNTVAGKPLTINQIKSDTKFLHNGSRTVFDFINKWSIDPSYNNGMPYLDSEPESPLKIKKVYYRSKTQIDILFSADIDPNNLTIGFSGGVTQVSNNATTNPRLVTVTTSNHSVSQYTVSVTTRKSWQSATTSMTYSYKTLSGTGTIEDPFLIGSKDDLFLIEDNPSYHFKLTSDLNFLGEEIVPICGNGFAAFSGSFDGNNKTISNYKISRGLYNRVGLFGYVKGINSTTPAAITKLKISSPLVSYELFNLYRDTNISCFIGHGDYITIQNVKITSASISITAKHAKVGLNFAVGVFAGSMEYVIGNKAWLSSVKNSTVHVNTSSTINTTYNNIGIFFGNQSDSSTAMSFITVSDSELTVNTSDATQYSHYNRIGGIAGRRYISSNGISAGISSFNNVITLNSTYGNNSVGGIYGTYICGSLLGLRYSSSVGNHLTVNSTVDPVLTYVGGIAGIKDGVVSCASYFTCDNEFTCLSDKANVYVGGAVGENEYNRIENGIVISRFNNETTYATQKRDSGYVPAGTPTQTNVYVVANDNYSSITNRDTAILLTMVQLLDKANMPLLDFKNVFYINPGYNNGIPIIPEAYILELFDTINGINGSDYLQVNNVTKFDVIRYLCAYFHFQLTSDIDFQGNLYENGGTHDKVAAIYNITETAHNYSRIKGFNGNGHKISNIIIDKHIVSSNSYYRLWHELDESAEVFGNFLLENVSINQEPDTSQYIHIDIVPKQSYERTYSDIGIINSTISSDYKADNATKVYFRPLYDLSAVSRCFLYGLNVVIKNNASIELALFGSGNYGETIIDQVFAANINTDLYSPGTIQVATFYGMYYGSNSLSNYFVRGLNYTGSSDPFSSKYNALFYNDSISATRPVSNGYVSTEISPLELGNNEIIYSQSGINNFTNSFYNSDLAVNNGKPWLTAKTTEELKDIDTFTGFDFVNIWDIDEKVNDGYPYLRNLPSYFFTESDPVPSKKTVDTSKLFFRHRLVEEKKTVKVVLKEDDVVTPINEDAPELFFDEVYELANDYKEVIDGYDSIINTLKKRAKIANVTYQVKEDVKFNPELHASLMKVYGYIPEEIPYDQYINLCVLEQSVIHREAVKNISDADLLSGKTSYQHSSQMISAIGTIKSSAIDSMMKNDNHEFLIANSVINDKFMAGAAYGMVGNTYDSAKTLIEERTEIPGDIEGNIKKRKMNKLIKECFPCMDNAVENMGKVFLDNIYKNTLDFARKNILSEFKKLIDYKRMMSTIGASELYLTPNLCQIIDVFTKAVCLPDMTKLIALLEISKLQTMSLIADVNNLYDTAKDVPRKAGLGTLTWTLYPMIMPIATMLVNLLDEIIGRIVGPVECILTSISHEFSKINVDPRGLYDNKYKDKPLKFDILDDIDPVKYKTNLLEEVPLNIFKSIDTARGRVANNADKFLNQLENMFVDELLSGAKFTDILKELSRIKNLISFIHEMIYLTQELKKANLMGFNKNLRHICQSLVNKNVPWYEIIVRNLNTEDEDQTDDDEDDDDNPEDDIIIIIDPTLPDDFYKDYEDKYNKYITKIKYKDTLENGEDLLKVRKSDLSLLQPYAIKHRDINKFLKTNSIPVAFINTADCLKNTDTYSKQQVQEWIQRIMS